jgi:hypothetical protein
MRRIRSGKRIEVTMRDLELFKLLYRYQYLRSDFLYAFLGGESETHFKERLGDLYHDGRFINRPEQQWGTSKNHHRSRAAWNLLANDSGLFPFGFCAVHPKDAGDCLCAELSSMPPTLSTSAPSTSVNLSGVMSRKALVSSMMCMSVQLRENNGCSWWRSSSS